jgi:hypothetical protein
LAVSIAAMRDKTERSARILVAQTESCLVDEKLHMNTARFNLFRDSLRTARISEIRC